MTPLVGAAVRTDTVGYCATCGHATLYKLDGAYMCGWCEADQAERPKLLVECVACGATTARDQKHVDLADCLAGALQEILGDLVPGHCPGGLAVRINRRASGVLATWRARPRT